MAFKKKTWVDRLSEFPGRRSLKIISGPINNEMVVDVTRAEGEVSRAGDPYNAANMNDLEQRIEEEFNTINGNLIDIVKSVLVSGNIPAIATNADYTVTISINIPDGYKIWGIGAIANAHYGQSLSGYGINANVLRINFHNNYGSNLGVYNGGVTATIFFIRSLI